MAWRRVHRHTTLLALILIHPRISHCPLPLQPTRHLVLEDVDGRAEDEDIRSLLWEYGMVEEMTRFRGREIAFVTMR